MVQIIISFLFQMSAKPMGQHLCPQIQVKGWSQFISTELKEQKSTHVQGGNAKKPIKVLLKKSLPGMRESFNMAHVTIMPPKNKTLREWVEPEKKKVVQKSHVGDDGNSLESDLCVNSQQQKYRNHILRL